MADAALRTDRSALLVPAALVVIAITGLGARLFHLGQRVYYYDEAWFGYWTLKFLDHGVWEYRPVLHGPFLVRVHSLVFSVVGANDFTGRVVVAVIGGLLPLAAWLVRDHLRDVEVIALGVFLAFNPVLLYYSRFMRNDVPLAAFMLVSLGFLSRAYVSGEARYLHLGAVSLALAATTKESVLLWLLSWVGAGAIVLDTRLMRSQARGVNPGSWLRRALHRVVRTTRRWPGQLLGAWFLFTGVLVLFYAPRAGSTQRIGLWKALGGNPSMLPAVVYESTFGALVKALEYWLAGGMQNHPYIPYLLDTLATLRAGALPILLLSVLGFFVDRYTGSGPRVLVSFTFYIGVAAIVGYPLANALPVPWSTVHAIVPLAVPAAVGTGSLLRRGRDLVSESIDAVENRSLADLEGWRLSARLALAGGVVLVFGFFAFHTASAAWRTSYAAPHESPDGFDGGHEIVYSGQAPGRLRILTTAIASAARNGGRDVDVLYVGSDLDIKEWTANHPPPAPQWYRRFPLPWYTESTGAQVQSVAKPKAIGQDPPPVVITSTSLAGDVEKRLGHSYVRLEYRLDDAGYRRLVGFTKPSKT
ncbi:MAG: flippase activity-associated protein Agl23 [Halodesulfurarchaeum sp.]